MNNKLSVAEILQQDLAKIYLGNLSTVDSDINLPSNGENGSVFVWLTSAPNIIDSCGKVTRPQYGAGNRRVTLTVIAKLNDEQLEKTFEANVIEQNYSANVIYSYGQTIYSPIGRKPYLPPVAVIHNSLEEDAVIPVVWEDISDKPYWKEGRFTVRGTVEDNVEVNCTVVVTNNQDLLQPLIDNNTVAQKIPYEQTQLTPQSDFYQSMTRSCQYLLYVNDDSMLYNFRVAANLDTKGAPPMTGWDDAQCNLKGHTTGHYLSGLALCYAATKNSSIKQKLDYMVEQLLICRDGMAKRGDCQAGFLSAYNEEQFNLLESYTPYPTIWAPYYTLHKIMAGLRDCYIYGKNQDAYNILKGLGDWVYNRLSKLTENQRQKMWSMYIAGEFGGMNEVMADLYALTKDEKYLAASRWFDNDKLYIPMKMNIDVLGNLHANQHIPQIIGALRQFSLTGEQRYFNIANNFWNMVTKSHLYSIGGTGETEMFKAAGKIAAYISDKSAESCASYNMLKLTSMLFEYSPCAEYMDYYEKTLYNHINACGDIEGPTGGSTYFMPSQPGAHKHFDLEENSCCHGTGLENHFKYQENIFFKSDDSLYINLFIPSEMYCKENDAYISVKTKICTDNITACINFSVPDRVKIKIRKPYWCENPLIKNGDITVHYSIENGYMVLSEDLKDSCLTIILDCKGWLCPTYDMPNIASVCWGPYVLAAIDKSTNYLEFDINEYNISSKLVHKGNLNFSLDSKDFKPLSHIDSHTPYHLYIKTV